MEPLPGMVNYFIGNDPAKWRTTIPTYAKVQYQDAYPGIALAYYGNQGRLEYDFLVAPGADPNQFTLAFEGASAITVAESGDLLLTTALGDVRMQKPVVYQLEPDGHKTLVAGHYAVASTSVSLQASRTTRYAVGFQLASYDHAKPVVIDPVLLYSTYLGGSNDDLGYGIAVDTAGSAYVTGYTGSTNFPTANPVQATNGGGFDAFVAKLTTNVPFAAFRANAEIELRHRLHHDEQEMRHQSHDEDFEARHRPHEDAFEMTATFTLDPNNNGIAPLTEAVTVQVGPFSTTIPAGSFTLKKGRFTYEGVINGVRLEAVLRSLILGNDYKFTVEGKGADLTGVINPVTVGLTIGDDSGSKPITAKFE
jgi:Beta-propeller repeat